MTYRQYHCDTIIFGPPTLVGIETLEFTLVRACVRACVRPSVRPCVRKILNDYPLYFSEILHGVTTLYWGKRNLLGFLKIIFVASPGALLWLKRPQNALKWLKMTLFAL